LGVEEIHAVRAVLNSPRFQDCSPAAINATLLDEGQYLCSTRTMYRVLEVDGATRERRDQLTHPKYQKPELLASAPNQLWSWDITKLRGPAKWTYFYLYVILDVFSRYVVGWMVAPRESAELAKKLIEESCEKQNIQPSQLTLHADRGSAMRSKPVALLLADLSVTKTHSRPYTSNDNPYSESHFRTMKHTPRVPRSVWLHPGQPGLLPDVFPLVQRRTSPLWNRHDVALDGAPRCCGQHPRKPPTRSRCRLSRPPRTLRPPTPFAASASKRGLDQQTIKLRRKYSLNNQKKCLKFADTHRRPHSRTSSGFIGDQNCGRIRNHQQSGILVTGFDDICVPLAASRVGMLAPV
jgi:hypothetical protein